MKKDWQYNPERNEITGIDDGNCRVIVATPYGKDTKERDEHGSLIAAAAELYESLIDIFHYTGGADSALEDEHLMARVEQALAKAEAKP